MASETQIENVADTALYVAVYRAEESERPDALFKDPLAKKLAGDRGRRIAEGMPNAKIMRWVMAVRTTAIDRLILKAIEQGVDTVLNLGAGVDTRPYRMKLPAELCWIEVDFPQMIDLKNARLADDKPVCRLERIAVDLSNHEDRIVLLNRVSRDSKSILVITEGVLIYLTNDDAGLLAADLYKKENIHFWIQDYYNHKLSRYFRGRMKNKMKAAPIRFEPDSWFGFFGERGWEVSEKISSTEEGKRVGRKCPLPFPWWILAVLTQFRDSRDFSGYTLLKRKANP